jgi:hypothetical protein
MRASDLELAILSFLSPSNLSFATGTPPVSFEAGVIRFEKRSMCSLVFFTIERGKFQRRSDWRARLSLLADDDDDDEIYPGVSVQLYTNVGASRYIQLGKKKGTTRKKK